MNQTEIKAAAHLIKNLGIESLRITTFDDAYNAVIQAFFKKGNTNITDQEKFNQYVSGFLPEQYSSRQDIINAVYKSAKKEYERLQS